MQLIDHETLLNLAVDAIVVIDEAGRIEFSNQALQRMFGWKPEEVLGKNVSILMPSPDRERHDSYIGRYLSSGQARVVGVGRQVTAQRRDGTVFPVHLAVNQVMLDGKRRFTGFIRDISDIVQLETEYLAREERVLREERKYLSRELHDSVSQALFGIVMGTQAALGALDKPERAREALDYVLSLAESGLAEMRALILELRPESLESEGLTGSIARQVKAAARRFRLELELDLGREPTLAIATKQEFYRMGMEAVNNVLKHAQASRLKVAFESQPGFYALEVEDDGVGFRPEEVPPTRVGLQSLRERAERLGAALKIESSPGMGTKIRIRLPLT